MIKLYEYTIFGNGLLTGVVAHKGELHKYHYDYISKNSLYAQLAFYNVLTKSSVYYASGKETTTALGAQIALKKHLNLDLEDNEIIFSKVSPASSMVTLNDRSVARIIYEEKGTRLVGGTPVAITIDDKSYMIVHIVDQNVLSKMAISIKALVNYQKNTRTSGMILFSRINHDQYDLFARSWEGGIEREVSPIGCAMISHYMFSNFSSLKKQRSISILQGITFRKSLSVFVKNEEDISVGGICHKHGEKNIIMIP